MAFIPGRATVLLGRRCTTDSVCARRVPALRMSLAAAWAPFAANMAATGRTPKRADWNRLLDVCVDSGEDAERAIWVINLMRETGVAPDAASYERVLRVCHDRGDRAAAFHMVEGMFDDKVLLGDVELPEGMEEVLRKILPPEAFE